MDDRESLRLTEILTTAAAVANYLGRPDVSAEHVLRAIAILQGRETMEGLGRPVSPLVPRQPGAGGADPRVRQLAQRWFAILGSDVAATFSSEQLADFMVELSAMAGDG